MRDPLAPIAALDAALPEARAANLRLGTELAIGGHVDFVAVGAEVAAVVTGPAGSSTRTVTFTERGGTLGWSCTCMSDPSPWCKHAVAAVVAAAATTGEPATR